jgi:hypothetical protein
LASLPDVVSALNLSVSMGKDAAGSFLFRSLCGLLFKILGLANKKSQN